jgi:hypothetical protein
MFPSNFKVLAEYFVVPLLVLLISYAISGQFSLKYSAGTDFFIFFFSADIGAVMEYEDLRQRINPAFRDQYLPVFAVLLTLSVLFVIVSGLTQRKIETWREHERSKTSWRYHPPSSAGSAVKYPIAGVIGCWLATVTLMPAQLFVFFGKG